MLESECISEYSTVSSGTWSGNLYTNQSARSKGEIGFSHNGEALVVHGKKQRSKCKKYTHILQNMF